MELLRRLMARAQAQGELREGLCCTTAATLVGCALVGGLRIHLMHPGVIDIEHGVLSGLDIALCSIRR